MTPLAFPIGAPELVIILVIVLLLFGGSRLAGLGKSTGRALKEFKEETKGLRDSDKTDAPTTTTTTAPQQLTGGQQAPAAQPWPQTPPTNLADPSVSEIRKDA